MSHHHTRLLKLFTSATLPSVSLSLSLSLPLSPSFPLASPLPLNAAWSTNLAKAYGAYGVSHTRIITHMSHHHTHMSHHHTHTLAKAYGTYGVSHTCMMM